MGMGLVPIISNKQTLAGSRSRSGLHPKLHMCPVDTGIKIWVSPCAAPGLSRGLGMTPPVQPSIIAPVQLKARWGGRAQMTGRDLCIVINVTTPRYPLPGDLSPRGPHLGPFPAPSPSPLFPHQVDARLILSPQAYTREEGGSTHSSPGSHHNNSIHLPLSLHHTCLLLPVPLPYGGHQS